jgi:formate hydrogenlyase subunit 3/multisubunit Na+/H+ antiporter MnhD subunit
MTAPMFLFVLTGVLAVTVALLRKRSSISVTVAAVGAALLASFTFLINLEEPFMVFGLPIKFGTTWRILGRTLALDEGNRAGVGFLYLTGAFVIAGAWVAKTNRNLYYTGLLCIGAIAASLMVQPFLFAALFLEFTALGSVIILVPPGQAGTKSGLRLTVLYTLATLAILFAGWFLENVGVTSATPDLARQTTLLLALGFAVIMVVPPFHFWLPTAAEESNPYALAFVTVMLQSAGLFFLLRFLDSFVWLREVPNLFDGIRFVGTAMIWFGGILSISQTSFTKVMAYALLTDFGVMLLAVGLGTPNGFRLALGLTGVRVVGMSVWALGLAILLKRNGEDQLQSLRGAVYSLQLPVFASLVGVLSIAGFPLTAGFPARWALITSLAPTDPIGAWSIIFALLSVGAVALRWTSIFFQKSIHQERSTLTYVEWVFLGGGVAMCIILGIFPQLFYPWVVEAAAGMTQLFP